MMGNFVILTTILISFAYLIITLSKGIPNSKKHLPTNLLGNFWKILLLLFHFLLEIGAFFFLIYSGLYSIFKIFQAAQLKFSAYCEKDKIRALVDILDNIEFLFVAVIPYLVVLSYLKHLESRYPTVFLNNNAKLKEISEKKAFIGALIGIVVTNVVKILIKKKEIIINYEDVGAYFIQHWGTACLHLVVLIVLIWLYRTLASTSH